MEKERANIKKEPVKAMSRWKFSSKKFIVGLMLAMFFLIGGTAWYFDKYDTPDYEHRGFFPLTTLKPAWERKVDTRQVLKIGIITDTHVHPNRVDKKDRSDNAPRILRDKNIVPLQKFNTQMESFHPDLIVHLGDVIDGTKERVFVGMQGLELVADELEKNEVPVYWAIGNHDLRCVTKDEFKRTLQIEDLDQVIDNGDYRLIFLDTNYYEDGGDVNRNEAYNRGFLPQEKLDWLEGSLKTEKRVFLFLHHAAFSENMHKEKNITKVSIKNAEDLISLLENYNAEAIFNGHIETRFYGERNGIEYYSLTGALKSDKYPQSYHELIIDSGNTEVTTFYTDIESGEEKNVKF